jgi:hypothetical protein
VIVVEHREPPQVREVIVPVYVPVVSRSHRGDRTVSGAQTYDTRFIPTTGLSAPPPPPPVYWGFGGKLRPDAWQPTPTVQERKTEGKSERKERKAP